MLPSRSTSLHHLLGPLAALGVAAALPLGAIPPSESLSELAWWMGQPTHQRCHPLGNVQWTCKQTQRPPCMIVVAAATKWAHVAFALLVAHTAVLYGQSTALYPTEDVTTRTPTLDCAKSVLMEMCRTCSRESSAIQSSIYEICENGGAAVGLAECSTRLELQMCSPCGQDRLCLQRCEDSELDCEALMILANDAWPHLATCRLGQNAEVMGKVRARCSDDVAMQGTREPMRKPTALPTEMPSALPTEKPTALPTQMPTEMSTAWPTEKPTALPTMRSSSLDSIGPMHPSTPALAAAPSDRATTLPPATNRADADAPAAMAEMFRWKSELPVSRASLLAELQRNRPAIAIADFTVETTVRLARGSFFFSELADGERRRPGLGGDPEVHSSASRREIFGGIPRARHSARRSPPVPKIKKREIQNKTDPVARHRLEGRVVDFDGGTPTANLNAWLLEHGVAEALRRESVRTHEILRTGVIPLYL